MNQFWRKIIDGVPERQTVALRAGDAGHAVSRPPQLALALTKVIFIDYIIVYRTIEEEMHILNIVRGGQER